MYTTNENYHGGNHADIIDLMRAYPELTDAAYIWADCSKHFYGWTEQNLYSCNAYIYITRRYIYLQSYATNISVYDVQNKKLYSLMRAVWGYSNTSAQHSSKFKRWLGENGYTVQSEYVAPSGYYHVFRDLYEYALDSYPEKR